MSIYDDDEAVKTLTQGCIDEGIRVLQIFQHGSEAEHVKYLLSEFTPPFDARVLDAGCGIGEVARLMFQMRPDLKFTLLNVSAAQLEMCPDEFDTIHGSVENIPARDNSFDAAMALYVMGHCDQQRAMDELRRVVRPGGVIFVYDLDGGGEYLKDLDYTAHAWGGTYPTGLNTDQFSKLMPEFSTRYPKVRPVIVREVK